VVNQRVETVNQEIHMSNRTEGYVTGVMDVISFDLEEIVLDTTAGLLRIKGSKLHVKSINLDKQRMEFEGNVNNIFYSDSKAMKRKNLMGRLFG
jgi:sporulation protein YabP